jgi:surface polysaccharide O-acyltransferase-like enzyme
VETVVTSDLDVEKTNDFLVPVDLIRVCGIFMVILLHAANEYYTTPIIGGPLDSALYWWTATIYKSLTLPCVPLFIMLSGALLLQPSKLNESIRVFFKKRVSRVGIAFVFWTLIYLLWAFYVSQTPITYDNVVSGLFYSFSSGAYYHFWFLYALIGLYLLTPIVRTLILADSQKVIRYFIALWGIGAAIIPFIELASGYPFNDTVFVMAGTLGYFVLGIYLQRKWARSLILSGVFILGAIFTVIATWLLTFQFSSLNQNYFFFEYTSATVILTSAALFLFFSRFRAFWPETDNRFVRGLVDAISKNTLPIYLFHVIILETLQRGYLGFKLSFTTINPIVSVPIIAVVTLFISLGLVLLMKKVPILKTLIG